MQVGQKCNIEDMRRSKNTPPNVDSWETKTHRQKLDNQETVKIFFTIIDNRNNMFMLY